MPIAGYRDHEDGIIYDQLNYGSYWSSSPRGRVTPEAARDLDFDASIVDPSYNSTRAYGLSVRCVSNDYLFSQPSMTIHPNG